MSLRIVAIYTAPTGAPAPFEVQPWEYSKGEKPTRIGEPVYAATLELARETFPRTGLVKHDPRKVPFEAARLLETWEPSEESKEANKS